MELTMKSYWRVLFVALAYLAYAGQAQCEEFATEGPSHPATSVWPTEGQRSFGYASQPPAGEFQRVSGEADPDAATGGGPTLAPVQVGKVDLNACEDCCSPVWAHRSGM